MKKSKPLYRIWRGGEVDRGTYAGNMVPHPGGQVGHTAAGLCRHRLTACILRLHKKQQTGETLSVKFQIVKEKVAHYFLKPCRKNQKFVYTFPRVRISPLEPVASFIRAKKCKQANEGCLSADGIENFRRGPGGRRPHVVSDPVPEFAIGIGFIFVLSSGLQESYSSYWTG